MKMMINYQSSSGVVHKGTRVGFHTGTTKCGIGFTVRHGAYNAWAVTNKEVTCKNCAPPKKLIVKVDENISVFGINTPEKATFATIRARILSMLETWEKHAKGKTSKKEFYSDLRWDLGDIDTDLHQYMYTYKNKVWDDERKMYVKASRKLPVNKIKHDLDGKIPGYYSYECCQSNTCKCGRKVVEWKTT